MADFLTKKIEKFSIPRSLRTRNAARFGKVYRDLDESQAGRDLSDEITSALRDSNALIVICSPDAKASRWVNEEIRVYRSQNPDSPIIPVLIEGEVGVAFPSSLLNGDGDAQAYPVACDFRSWGQSKSKRKLEGEFERLVAGILGVGADAVRDRVRQRRVQQSWIIAGASTTLALTFAAIAYFAVLQRNEAVEQEQLAVTARDEAFQSRNASVVAEAVARRNNEAYREFLLEVLASRVLRKYGGQEVTFETVHEELRDVLRFDEGNLSAYKDVIQDIISAHSKDSEEAYMRNFQDGLVGREKMPCGMLALSALVYCEMYPGSSCREDSLNMLYSTEGCKASGE